jgi:hypothetical protein
MPSTFLRNKLMSALVLIPIIAPIPNLVLGRLGGGSPFEGGPAKYFISFYFSNTNANANYEVSISNQKWNFIAFNYFDSKVDLYVNGNLERTFYFTNNIPDYSSNDTVLLGSDGGVTGAICNVTYSKAPLSFEQIATMYNINYLKNPPVDFNE